MRFTLPSIIRTPARRSAAGSDSVKGFDDDFLLTDQARDEQSHARVVHAQHHGKGCLDALGRDELGILVEDADDRLRVGGLFGGVIALQAEEVAEVARRAGDHRGPGQGEALLEEREVVAGAEIEGAIGAEAAAVVIGIEPDPLAVDELVAREIGVVVAVALARLDVPEVECVHRLAASGLQGPVGEQDEEALGVEVGSHRDHLRRAKRAFGSRRGRNGVG